MTTIAPNPLRRRPPTISLCMIVRDEAASLEACLASARDAVDEIIVVDTGSADGAPEIARQAGAQVFFFPWCDDFAAARNASLAPASGDWVLWLDADERLAPGSAAVLRAAIAQDDFDCGLLLIHNASRPDAAPEEVVAGGARADDPILQRRLLRRTPDLRFQGIVHEHLGPWLEAAERRVRTLPAHIVHYGYTLDALQSRQKVARNLRLLERQLEIEGPDYMTYSHLAHTALLAGQPEKAWAATEQGWALLPHLDPAQRPSLARLAAVRAQMQLSRGDPRGALDTVQTAERIQGPAADYDYLRGEAYLALAGRAASADARQQHLDLAHAAYRAALAKQDQVSTAHYIPGASSYRPRVGLGLVAMRQGEFAQALDHFEVAATQGRAFADAQLGRVEALAVLGQEERLLAALQELEDTDLAPFAAAVAAEYLGAIDDFALVLDRARELAGQGKASERMVEQLSAAYVRLRAYSGGPASGPGVSGAVCALLAGQSPQRPPLPLDPWEQRQVGQFVRNLARIGLWDLTDRLASPLAERALPGIQQVVADVSRQFIEEARERARALAELERAEPGTVSVVILTWNELDATRRCVEGLKTHVRMPMEIIAVDNGSTDGTVEFWQEQVRTSLGGRAPVRAIFNPGNRGFPVGCNQGLALAQGDYVCFLNNDAVVREGALERLAAWLRYDPTIGLIGPRTNYAGGHQMIPGAPRDDPAAIEAFARQWVQEHDGVGVASLRLLGLCLMGRREVFQHVGGFDPRFSPGNFEDDDLCVRVARAGYRVWTAHDCFVTHEGHRTIRKLPISFRALLERNRRLYYEKWGGAEGEPVAAVTIRAARGQFDPERDYISPEQGAPWPLATDRPRRLLAWPDWTDPEDLAETLRLVAPLGGQRQACLCLRLDPERDPPVSEAVAALNAAEAQLGVGLDRLEVLLVDDPMEESDWPRLGAAVSAALAVLPPAGAASALASEAGGWGAGRRSGEGEVRRRFLRALGRPVASTEAQVRAVAQGQPLTATPGLGGPLPQISQDAPAGRPALARAASLLARR